MVELTIQIPDELAQRLQPMQNRLAEVIELGLREMAQPQRGVPSEVIEFLASGPSPQAIIDFRPSAEAQARVNELLRKNQDGTLTPAEQAELDEYEHFDHIMTLLKAHTRQRQSLAGVLGFDPDDEQAMREAIKKQQQALLTFVGSATTNETDDASIRHDADFSQTGQFTRVP
jgi:hypothetical protein